jgi:chromosome segregation ATPase
VEEAKVLKEAVKARDGEVLREQRRRERLDKELRETRTKLENSNRDTEMKVSEVEEAHQEAIHLEAQLKESKLTLEKYLKDYSTLATRTSKVTEEFEEAIKKNQALHVALNKAEKEEKLRREEIVKLTTDAHTMERKFDREHREKLDLQQKLADSKTPLLALQHEKAVLEKDLEQCRREVVLLTSEKDAAGRAKQLQEKQTQRALGQARNNSDQAKEQERIAYSLEAEVTTLKLEAKELRNIIYSVEKEREKYGVEAADQRRLYAEAMEEVKSKDVQIAELLKKVYKRIVFRYIYSFSITSRPGSLKYNPPLV